MDDELNRRLVKLEDTVDRNQVAIKEIQTVLLGPAKNDGLVRIVDDLKNEVKEAIEWGQTVWNDLRKKECYGLAAIDEHKKDHIKQSEEDGVVKVANINLRGVYYLGIIQVIGILASIVIPLLTK